MFQFPSEKAVVPKSCCGEIQRAARWPHLHWTAKTARKEIDYGRSIVLGSARGSFQVARTVNVRCRAEECCGGFLRVVC